MIIELNGETRDLAEARPLDQLLADWGYVKGFAVALNGDFLPRSHYAATIINPGDAIEIVTPMQGG